MNSISIFITGVLLLLGLSAQAHERDLLIEELSQALEEVRVFGDFVPPCQECVHQYLHCQPRVLAASAMRYGMELAGFGRDDAPLRRVLHENGLTIQGRIIGRSIQVQEGQLEVHLLNRRDKMQLRFGASGDPFAMDSSTMDGEAPCNPELINNINAQVRTTLAKYNTLGPEQREGWKKFCEEYPEYERVAKQREATRWRDEENRAYRGCPANISWKRIAAMGLCGGGGLGGYPLYSPTVFQSFPNSGLPRAFMYMFDGFGDFNPRRAISEGAINLRGDETGEPFTGWSNANGLSLYSRTVSSMERDGLSRRDFQLHYQDGSGFNEVVDESRALGCHADMQKWLDQIGPVIPGLQRPRTVVMGYSNGGAAALNFQRGVGRSGREVDLLITLDPIPRPSGYVLRNLTFSDWLTERHPNTRRHINFFQDQDYGSAPPLELRSQALSGADQNIYVTPTDWARTDGRQAHVHMVRNAYRVDERVRCELENYLGDHPRLCL